MREDVTSVDLDANTVDIVQCISSIQSFAKKGNLIAAIDALRMFQISGAEVSRSLWTAALDACVVCKDLDQAKSCMKEIEATYTGHADVSMYSALLKAHLCVESWHGAQKVLGKMRRAGLTPTEGTYNDFFTALHSGDMDSKGMHISAEVLEEMTRDGVRPSRNLCSILLRNLNARSSNAEINRVLELPNRMDQPMD